MRAAVLALLAIAAPAAADPLQDRVFAGMRGVETGDVGFTATTAIERSGAAKQVIVTRYDPRAAAGRRWTVVRVGDRAPTAKETAQILKAANGTPVPAYSKLLKWFGGPATRVAQTGSTVTYRFARLPAGTVKMGSHDASADTVADAVVNTAGAKPFVERVHLSSAKPFRMALVARVAHYDFYSSYAPLPDGRPFPTGTDGEIAGSVMGKGGTLATHSRYAEVRATR